MRKVIIITVLVVISSVMFAGEAEIHSLIASFDVIEQEILRVHTIDTESALSKKAANNVPDWNNMYEDVVRKNTQEKMWKNFTKDVFGGWYSSEKSIIFYNSLKSERERYLFLILVYGHCLCRDNLHDWETLSEVLVELPQEAVSPISKISKIYFCSLEGFNIEAIYARRWPDSDLGRESANNVRLAKLIWTDTMNELGSEEEDSENVKNIVTEKDIEKDVKEEIKEEAKRKINTGHVRNRHKGVSPEDVIIIR